MRYLLSIVIILTMYGKVWGEAPALHIFEGVFRLDTAMAITADDGTIHLFKPVVVESKVISFPVVTVTAEEFFSLCPSAEYSIRLTLFGPNLVRCQTYNLEWQHMGVEK